MRTMLCFCVVGTRMESKPQFFHEFCMMQGRGSYVEDLQVSRGADREDDGSYATQLPSRSSACVGCPVPSLYLEGRFIVNQLDLAALVHENVLGMAIALSRGVKQWGLLCCCVTQSHDVHRPRVFLWSMPARSVGAELPAARQTGQTQTHHRVCAGQTPDPIPSAVKCSQRKCKAAVLPPGWSAGQARHCNAAVALHPHLVALPPGCRPPSLYSPT